MGGDGDIVFEVAGALGRVTLNRPGALNALTLDMTRRLDARLIEWAADGGVGAVVIEGAGARGFCAGGDVRVHQILEGTNEIMRVIIARRLLDI